MSTPPVLAVVGTGLIGTSVAQAAIHSGWVVLLRDLDPATQERAVACSGARPWRGEAPDLIVVAAPPAETAAIVAESLRTHLNATVMDVASVKYNVVIQVEALGGDRSRFVPSHPMAGRERSGPGAARPDLFADRVWVTCPGAERGHAQRASALIAAARAVEVPMGADVHDRAVATTSHAAQVLSSALAARLLTLTPQEVGISGQGLRDATRLAASDPALWQQILRGNAREVAVTLRAVASDVNAVAKELERLSDLTTDEHIGMSTIEDLLTRGREGQGRIPGRHGQASERFTIVAVRVPDEPGALARVFAAAGELGVNLEDVRIDHLWGRPSGLIELSVVPDHADGLRTGLADRGFDVRA